jgi:hypothetical protein
MSQKTPARIFHTDNAFDRTALSPGGVSAAEAINRAEAAIEEMRPEVEVWFDTALAEITRVTGQFRKNQLDPDSFAMLKRNASYLQDLGSTMGFPLITFVAQNFCDVLDTMETGTPASKAMVECHANALLLARQDKYRNLEPAQVAELTEGLRSLLRIASSPRTAP